MASPPSVGINDDFAACESSISSWSSNNKSLARVDDNFGLLVIELGGDRGHYDAFSDLLSDLLVGNLGVMLG